MSLGVCMGGQLRLTSVVPETFQTHPRRGPHPHEMTPFTPAWLWNVGPPGAFNVFQKLEETPNG